MACGDIKFLEGGVLKDSTVINADVTGSKINDSVVSASTLDGCRITNLVGIDDATAAALGNDLANNDAFVQQFILKLANNADFVQSIALKFADLPQPVLELLAKAIFSSAQVDVSTPPAQSEEDVIPTTMYGDRNAALGTPMAWGTLFGYSIPLYRKQ